MSSAPNQDFELDEDTIKLLEKLNLSNSVRQYLNQRQLFSGGIKEIQTKLEILDEEFRTRHDYNPIHHIESRLKSPRSMLAKLHRKGYPLSLQSIRENLTDTAGIRVICNYIDDIYHIADMLLAHDDIRLIKRNDYIENPKPSGYRSLHLVVEVPVFLASSKQYVPVEIQIRTIAMDFWASLEHKLKYKLQDELSDSLAARLRLAADQITALDVEMQDIQKEIQNL